ncbi:NADPH:quinone reductase-like Zn-dependent oxidoreductase [Algoriphagus boseongensis]|uniref:NADPH:quinone reductase-like Zn-dependent oxidoreductase n=1 Tax=Algoriphagus boseongensis TaxID=1442587 RepID=A0A4R6T4J3_9BACT|nr:NAD(P)-dependent alcohol dehydrogenase [Algoriphagus boseongensis]TDQ16365.1 NADPH:quinone reductase-like Zn-dependent oxidoreductase [Algoriphagus boseongensis]
MKASYRSHYCSPDEIQLKEIPIPEPKANEVLVEIKATTVNRTDMGVLTGKPYAMRAFAGFPNPKKPVTGTDFAGIIKKVGAEVKEFKEGDRVWGFNDNGAGTHAEFACYPVKDALLKFPDSIDFAEMVTCAEGAHYAVNFINKVNLSAGMKVLVNGGTGAIGSAAIQILKSMGIEVTAVCFQKDAELVKSLGPDRVIEIEKQDFTQENHHYDFVFDAVGKSRFSLCKRILKPDGIYISSELGPNWENLWRAMGTPFLGKPKVIFPIPTDIQESMKKVQDLYLQGKFKPLIDPKRFTLDQIREAFTYVSSGKKIGNVILEI